MQKNDVVKIEITSFSFDGYGVGRYNNVPVFVPLTAIGDVVEVIIVKVKKTYCYGKLLKIIKPSSDRITVDCPCFDKCGGCVYRHIDYKKELSVKESKVYDAVKRIGKVDLLPNKILFGESNSYRNKCQMPITDDYTAGFFAVHSHRIIPVKHCLLQPQIFNIIADTVTDFLKSNSISVYNEETGTGLFRHLYLRYAKATGEIMVVLVINGYDFPKLSLLTDELLKIENINLKSVYLNVNTEKTNVILGEKCILKYGTDTVTDIINGTYFNVSPLSFYQVNHDMTEKLYALVEKYAEPNYKKVIDLYCGAGTIGLTACKKADSIIGVEIVPDAVRNARHNAKINKIDNAEFICDDAKEAAITLKSRNIKADVVIVDPPRKGCDKEVLKIIANDFAPERIVYVSCDPATLGRDIYILNELGYFLKEYTPVDMFPRTSHVETVALLLKNMGY